MPTIEPPTLPSDSLPQTIVRPRATPREKSKAKRQPPYGVILHNDDINTQEYVIAVLRKVFHYGVEKAIQLMLEAHRTGRSIVWTGCLELAELKADQLRSCGPDPNVSHLHPPPLGVSIEPLPE